MIFVLSVGGGDLQKNISANLVRALQYAGERGASVIGIVGRNGGYTAGVADACVIVPTVNPETVTPHAEAFQAVVWHLLVSHPALRAAEMKWESHARPKVA
jgi:D-sedoheptulose 7-phosphate isomerase